MGATSEVQMDVYYDVNDQYANGALNSAYVGALVIPLA
jgi:hypothetical protein